MVGKEICERKCAVRRRDGPGWWLGRGMVLFVSYSQFARNQPSRMKMLRMKRFTTKVHIDSSGSLMQVMIIICFKERVLKKSSGQPGKFLDSLESLQTVIQSFKRI